MHKVCVQLKRPKEDNNRCSWDMILDCLNPVEYKGNSHDDLDDKLRKGGTLELNFRTEQRADEFANNLFSKDRKRFNID